MIALTAESDQGEYMCPTIHPWNTFDSQVNNLQYSLDIEHCRTFFMNVSYCLDLLLISVCEDVYIMIGYDSFMFGSTMHFTLLCMSYSNPFLEPTSTKQ